MAKNRMPTIKRRNTIISNILEVIIKQDNFLISGHKNPDEDCIASMIALGLLINKFSKNVYLMIPRKINKNFQYLLNICRYNTIGLIYTDEEIPVPVSAVFIMDTPKPSMEEDFPDKNKIFSDNSIIKIEFDHHLGADSDYIGDKEYCLVDEASSASELVGFLAIKLKHHANITDSFNIQDLFTRNFVLAVLTGIIGDSKMGKFLKTSREKWFYSLFSNMFNEMLANKTHKNSKNFSTMNEVFTELQQLSEQEDECFTLMMEQKVNLSPKIGTVIISRAVVQHMNDIFDHDTIITVARYAADSLAEYSKKLSLVVYYDEREDSDLVQFRMRRSHSFKNLDLRTVLKKFHIKNGGGHPGAIGFRIPESEIENLDSFIKNLVKGTEDMIA